MASLGELCIVNDRIRAPGWAAGTRWCAVGAVVTVCLLALWAPPAAAQTPAPQIISLSIDPPSPSPGQVVTVQVVCDHSGPVAFDDIDVAAGLAGGASPDGFQDDTASHGGSEWTVRSDTPLPGAGIHAVRVGTFTWQGSGDGAVVANCSSSFGGSSASLFFSPPPPVTDPSGSTVVPPPTTAGQVPAPPTAPRSGRSGLPATGRDVTAVLGGGLAAVGAGLLVLVARRRSSVADEREAESLTAGGEPPNETRWQRRGRR